MNHFTKYVLNYRMIYLLGLLSPLMLLASGCDSGSPLSKEAGKSPSAITGSESQLTETETVELLKTFQQHFIDQEYEEASKLGKTLSDDGKNIDGLHLRFGLASFANGDIEQSIELFDRALKVNPQIKPELWQRGIALYYNKEYQEGVDQFNSHQSFNSQDVENSVWQLMCQAQLTSVEDARKKMIPIERDRRKGMKEIFDMFAGTKTPEEVLAACGHSPGDEIVKDGTLYHGFLYVALYHEMMGETEKSREAIDNAIQARRRNTEFMYWIAQVHKDLRANEEAK
jgi:lipoprotein NlpI